MMFNFNKNEMSSMTIEPVNLRCSVSGCKSEDPDRKCSLKLFWETVNLPEAGYFLAETLFCQKPSTE